MRLIVLIALMAAGALFMQAQPLSPIIDGQTVMGTIYTQKGYGADSSNAVLVINTNPDGSSELCLIIPSDTLCIRLDPNAGGSIYSTAPFSFPGGGTNCVKTVAVTVPSADVLQLYSSPYQLLPAPGPGMFYNIVDVFGGVVNVGTPYDSYTNLSVGANPAVMDDGLFGNEDLLTSETDTLMQFGRDNKFYTSPNTPLNLYTSNGDPQNGDGDLILYITYQIVDVATGVQCGSGGGGSCYCPWDTLNNAIVEKDITMPVYIGGTTPPVPLQLFVDGATFISEGDPLNTFLYFHLNRSIGVYKLGFQNVSAGTHSEIELSDHDLQLEGSNTAITLEDDINLYTLSGNFRLHLAGGTANGYVLTSDALGNGTWKPKLHNLNSNTSGLNKYATLADAITDGLVSGDAFILTGVTLGTSTVDVQVYVP